MQYTTREMNGRYALFFTTGLGMNMVSSFLYEEGKIKLFEFEHHAITKGDAIKLRQEFGLCVCDPKFMKAIQE